MNPIYSFHKIQQEISSEISKIYNTDKEITIFADNHIVVANSIKLEFVDNNTRVAIVPKHLSKNGLKIISHFYQNFDSIQINFMRYIQMYHYYSTGFDAVPNVLIQSIISDVKSKVYGKEYLLPYKNKLSRLDSVMSEEFNKFDLFVTFRKDKDLFVYSIWKNYIDPENEDKFIEKDMLKTGKVDDIEEFVKNLFMYGNIIEF